MIHFQIDESIPEGEFDIHPQPLQQAAEATLHYAQASEESEISLVITGNEQIRQLNQQFLGIDAPTDVLSFPGDEVDPESGHAYLGDILIAYPYAQAQAAAAGHVMDDELRVLVVHGVLHLLGYDHGSEEERRHMWSAQAEILKNLGCPDDVIPV